jgi:Putative rhamnosyl transferase
MSSGDYLRDRPSDECDGVMIDHVFLTRFNLPSAGPESLIRAQEGWLHHRVEMFEHFTVPSMRSQTAVGSFGWLVFFDRESPPWLIDRLAPLVEQGVFTPVYGEQFTSAELVEYARALTGASSDILLTTNIDNDDAIAIDFVERLHALVQPGETMALYLGYGIILFGDHAYLRHDPLNAFVSVAEPWRSAKTVWRDWHNMLYRYMPVHSESGRAAWLQVVHGRNVSNRVRGKLVEPSKYRAQFPGYLDGLPAPSRVALVRDRLVSIPVREARETLRRTGKGVLLRTVGKGGLDNVKEWLQRRSSR